MTHSTLSSPNAPRLWQIPGLQVSFATMPQWGLLAWIVLPSGLAAGTFVAAWHVVHAWCDSQPDARQGLLFCPGGKHFVTAYGARGMGGMRASLPQANDEVAHSFFLYHEPVRRHSLSFRWRLVSDDWCMAVACALTLDRHGAASPQMGAPALLCWKLCAV